MTTVLTVSTEEINYIDMEMQDPNPQEEDQLLEEAAAEPSPPPDNLEGAEVEVASTPQSSNTSKNTKILRVNTADLNSEQFNMPASTRATSRSSNQTGEKGLPRTAKTTGKSLTSTKRDSKRGGNLKYNASAL
ncbi:hypothetical protein CROQUDRAFT_91331 [Cronartium quercuum f. sp. fusiforme G11]|uniref:Uncharacterized protein n=1 Tax=Cronartium quercuum f. sp. fusiforme G11 TaxID=708437 RepID=A0A9P6NKE6_9BASI|nr:hypothetical protein CROQUDRAFT_91331 [Cronartium quercuum f. sp. fusiforme G11]